MYLFPSFPGTVTGVPSVILVAFPKLSTYFVLSSVYLTNVNLPSPKIGGVYEYPSSGILSVISPIYFPLLFGSGINIGFPFKSLNFIYTHSI